MGSDMVRASCLKQLRETNYLFSSYLFTGANSWLIPGPAAGAPATGSTGFRGERAGSLVVAVILRLGLGSVRSGTFNSASAGGGGGGGGSSSSKRLSGPFTKWSERVEAK
jgi:hypothetical protein